MMRAMPKKIETSIVLLEAAKKCCVKGVTPARPPEMWRPKPVPAFRYCAQYTPQALNSILHDHQTNRHEAVKKLVEAGGGS